MMSGKNQVRARRNGEDSLEIDPEPVETQSNDPNVDVPCRRRQVCLKLDVSILY
jgi:hypothetical protein